METGTTEEKLLTREEVMRGWKDVPVQLLNGEALTIRVTAPSWKEVLDQTAIHKADHFALELAIVRLCIGDAIPRLEVLDLESRLFLWRVCLSFTQGEEQYKKKLEAARTILRTAFRNNTSPPPSASEPGTQAQKSTDGASQS